MNERIRQLAELSKSFKTMIVDGQMQSVLVINPERFAELILIEVTDILSTYRGKVMFEDGAEYNYEHPIIAIRKHFGVKE